MDLGLSPASLPLPGGSREFRSITEIPGARPYLHSSPPKGTDIRDRGKLGWGTRSNLNCGVRWDLGSPRHPLQASGPSLTAAESGRTGCAGCSLHWNGAPELCCSGSSDHEPSHTLLPQVPSQPTRSGLVFSPLRVPNTSFSMHHTHTYLCSTTHCTELQGSV